MPDTISNPKATFRPNPKGTASSEDIPATEPHPASPSENIISPSRDYLIPMFRRYEYARVVMRASSAYEAKLFTENLFAPDGWEVYPDWDNYKVIDIPSGGYA